ncbi:MAG: WG repeat-containing protein [Balneolaceae bacterium]|nr:WG repeat-containing protein [Balneolaceae bacterium]
MDSTFAYIVTPKYNWVQPFSEDLAAVSLDWKWGYIDRDEHFVIDPRYAAAGDFHGGRALVMERPATGKIKIINRAGTLIDEFSAVISRAREQVSPEYDDNLLFSCLAFERHIITHCAEEMFGPPENVYNLLFLSTPEHTKAGGSKEYYLYENGALLEETTGYKSGHTVLELPGYDFGTARRFIEKLAGMQNRESREESETFLKFTGLTDLSGWKRKGTRWYESSPAGACRQGFF